MHDLPLILYAVGLILALVDEIQANGKSLVGWAVVAIAAGLIYGWLA